MGNSAHSLDFLGHLVVLLVPGEDLPHHLSCLFHDLRPVHLLSLGSSFSLLSSTLLMVTLDVTLHHDNGIKPDLLIILVKHPVNGHFSFMFNNREEISLLCLSCGPSDTELDHVGFYSRSNSLKEMIKGAD